MDCPRCNIAMPEVYTRAGVVLDRCRQCSGLWFDQGEIYPFTHDKWALARVLRKGLIEPTPSPIACPRCKASMIEGGLIAQDLRVDECTACKGMWFDTGEIERALQLEGGLKRHPGAGAREPEPLIFVDAPPPNSRPPAARPRSAGHAGSTTMSDTPHSTAAPAPIQASDDAPQQGADPRSSGPAEAWATSDPAGSSAGGSMGALGAAAMALPVLPNLALRSGMVLLSLYGALYLVVYIATAANGMPPVESLALVAVIALIQFLVSPWITDLSLKWFMSLRWVDVSELPHHLQKFVTQTCEKEGIPVPSIGIIDDGNPNAFTYGLTPGNARLVITRGVMEILSPAELEAVVGHEIGHIVHWDFVVMTAAAMAPLLLYFIYDFCWRMGRKSDGKNNPFPAIAIVAYVCYVVGEYLVLMLSRIREYHADRYSAEVTHDPAALASALVKIAYGLVNARAEQMNAHMEATAKGAATRGPGAAMGAIKALGIFDPAMARGLVASSGFSTIERKDAILGAMQWDLWNPWATYYELQSTHPLAAHRIDQLGRMSFRFGQKPFIVFDRKKPESYWEEFLVDCFFMALPVAIPVLAFATGLHLGWAFGRTAGLVLAGLGVGILANTAFAYPRDEFIHYSVAALLSHVKVSAVRPIPATVEGTVIGKGVPGLIWSEDLVIRDQTGILLFNYRQPLAIFQWIFGLTAANTLQGQKVKASGWYRRAPVPCLELSQLAAGGQVYYCYVSTWRNIFGLLLVAAGVALALFGG